MSDFVGEKLEAFDRVAIEELPVLAEKGMSGAGQAVLRAVAHAQGQVSAGVTGGGMGILDETPIVIFGRRADGGQRVVREVAEKGVGADVEVAGVDIAVVLDHEIVTAVAAHRADGRDARRKAGDDGVEKANRDGMDVLRIPFVEDGAKKLAPLTGFQGVGPRGAMLVEFHAVDVLVVAELQLVGKVVVDLDGMALVGGGDEGEDVMLDLMALQDFETTKNVRMAAATIGAEAEVVVDVVRAIDRDADEKVLVVKKGSPVIIKLGAVGLEDVLNRSRLLVLVLEGNGLAEEVEAREGRFASLPSEGMDLHRDGKIVAGDLFQCLKRHSVRARTKEFDLRQVETIPATKVAVEGDWLDEKGEGLVHGRLLTFRRQPKGACRPARSRSEACRPLRKARDGP